MKKLPNVCQNQDQKKERIKIKKFEYSGKYWKLILFRYNWESNEKGSPSQNKKQKYKSCK